MKWSQDNNKWVLCWGIPIDHSDTRYYELIDVNTGRTIASFRVKD